MSVDYFNLKLFAKSGNEIFRAKLKCKPYEVYFIFNKFNYAAKYRKIIPNYVI